MSGVARYAAGSTFTDPALVVVEVADDGSTSHLTTIPLEGIDDIPCAIWAPDGRWAAFGGTDAVFVVDTETAEVRRVADGAPRDLEWRPGTDELAITGQALTDSFVGANAPIAIYTVSTGETRTVGDVEANELTWSPDGATIAYTQAVPGSTNMKSGITLIDADGTNERPLTTQSYETSQGIGVVWSPRGDEIAYQRERADCDPSRGCFEQSEIVLVTAYDTGPARPVGTERVIQPLPADILAARAVGRAQRHVVARRNTTPLLGRNPRPNRRTRRRHPSTQLVVQRRTHRKPRRRDHLALDPAPAMAAFPLTGLGAAGLEGRSPRT